MKDLELTFSSINDEGEIQSIEDLNRTSCNLTASENSRGVCSIFDINQAGDVSCLVRSESQHELTVVLVPMITWALTDGVTEDNVVFAESEISDAFHIKKGIESEKYILIVKRSNEDSDGELEVFIDFNYIPE